MLSDWSHQLVVPAASGVQVKRRIGARFRHRPGKREIVQQPRKFIWILACIKYDRSLGIIYWPASITVKHFYFCACRVQLRVHDLPRVSGNTRNYSIWLNWNETESTFLVQRLRLLKHQFLYCRIGRWQLVSNEIAMERNIHWAFLGIWSNEVS